mmetsp:Transcript_7469/g.12543  ORF Transcript_7469/g.12543 Transcript_7469/m.12543 type:complete len:233 (-) Transcript_7469:205-903(-)
MRYFCHSCQVEVDGRVSQENDEPECSVCGSNFVEKVGQRVEEFLALPQVQASQSSSSSVPTQSPPASSDSGGETTSSFQTSPQTPVMMMQLAGGGAMPINLQTQHGSSLLGGQPSQDLLTLLLRGTGLLSGSSDASGGNSGLDEILHQLFMNDQGVIATPTTPEAIEALNRERDVEKLQQLGECGITLEPFEEGDTAVIMPCEHVFKEEAILQWLQTHDTCPVCRLKISPQS